MWSLNGEKKNMSQIKTINLFGVEVEVEYEYTPEIPPTSASFTSDGDPGQSEEWEIKSVDFISYTDEGDDYTDLTLMNEANKDEIIRLLKG